MSKQVCVASKNEIWEEKTFFLLFLHFYYVMWVEESYCEFWETICVCSIKFPHTCYTFNTYVMCLCICRSGTAGSGQLWEHTDGGGGRKWHHQCSHALICGFHITTFTQSGGPSTCRHIHLFEARLFCADPYEVRIRFIVQCSCADKLFFRLNIFAR